MWRDCEKNKVIFFVLCFGRGRGGGVYSLFDPVKVVRITVLTLIREIHCARVEVSYAAGFKLS